MEMSFDPGSFIATSFIATPAFKISNSKYRICALPEIYS
jgi:hypothetical protein